MRFLKLTADGSCGYFEESGTVVREILTGVREKLTPAWQVLQQGDCCWKIRHHERHIEELRSQYLLAQRVT